MSWTQQWPYECPAASITSSCSSDCWCVPVVLPQGSLLVPWRPWRSWWMQEWQEQLVDSLMIIWGKAVLQATARSRDVLISFSSLSSLVSYGVFCVTFKTGFVVCFSCLRRPLRVLWKCFALIWADHPCFFESSAELQSSRMAVRNCNTVAASVCCRVLCEVKCDTSDSLIF